MFRSPLFWCIASLITTGLAHHLGITTYGDHAALWLTVSHVSALLTVLFGLWLVCKEED